MSAFADPADACVCAKAPVSANEPAGRVFFLHFDECRCAPACATSPENGAITPRCLQG